MNFRFKVQAVLVLSALILLAVILLIPLSKRHRQTPKSPLGNKLTKRKLLFGFLSSLKRLCFASSCISKYFFLYNVHVFVLLCCCHLVVTQIHIFPLRAICNENCISINQFHILGKLQLLR